MIKVLEVNVDDLGFGGVFSLVRTVIEKMSGDIQIDIGAIEKFANRANIEHFEELGSKVFYVGYAGNKWKKQIVCYKNLQRLLNKENYDIVHIHADVANKLFVSGLAAKNAGVKKIVLHSHSAGVDGNHRKFKVAVHKLCRPFLKRIATDFVACSDVAAEWMYPDVDKNNVTIIKNGIDLEKFRFDEKVRRDVRKSLGITSEILVGHIGRFAYPKNHEYILKIAAKAKEANVNCKFLLVGEGPELDRVKRMSREQNLDDLLIFYGTSNRVNQLFMAMDVFILPSRFEGLPIVGVEAQASGVPVIFSKEITKQAKVSENVVFNGISDADVAGWLEQIESFANLNPDRENAYIRLKNEGYSIESTVQAFRSLYLGELS